MKISIVRLFSILILILAAGCSTVRSPIIEPVVLESNERDSVLAYAQAPGENLLNGLIARDYAQFSQDFSDTMKQGMNQQAFDGLLVMLDTKLGKYQSFDLVTVLKDENYSTLVYQLNYEKDNQVSMRVVFDNKEPHQVSGLWFDSPELRKD
ncbi:MAG: DUF3887 domain-containing protein [Bellilinea sp.]|jgi:hypothetical protein